MGYLNAILAQEGGTLNKSIFESSNARGIVRRGDAGEGGGGGMLMFQIDRRISKGIIYHCYRRSVSAKMNVVH